MKKSDVTRLLQFFEALDILVWIDGGWGVDALLGKQTRDHSDLDIVVQKKDLPKLEQALKERGYSNVQSDDASDWNFVHGDKEGLLIDLHVIEIDENGDGLYGPIERGRKYPAVSLESIGTIDGVKVRCISPEYQVESHDGYELQEKDFHDARLLCERFDIELPKRFW